MSSVLCVLCAKHCVLCEQGKNNNRANDLDISKLVVKDDLKHVAEKEDLKGIARVENLKELAKTQDLTGFCNKTDLENFATNLKSHFDKVDPKKAVLSKMKKLMKSFDDSAHNKRKADEEREAKAKKMRKIEAKEEKENISKIVNEGVNEMKAKVSTMNKSRKKNEGIVMDVMSRESKKVNKRMRKIVGENETMMTKMKKHMRKMNMKTEETMTEMTEQHTKLTKTQGENTAKNINDVLGFYKKELQESQLKVMTSEVTKLFSEEKCNQAVRNATQKTEMKEMFAETKLQFAKQENIYKQEVENSANDRRQSQIEQGYIRAMHLEGRAHNTQMYHQNLKHPGMWGGMNQFPWNNQAPIFNGYHRGSQTGARHNMNPEETPMEGVSCVSYYVSYYVSL